MQLPSLVTGPTLEPIELADAKVHLRVDHADDDDYITALIEAARDWIEGDTWRALMPQTWRQQLDVWPAVPIRLSKPPIQSITSVTYKDADGNTDTLASSVYTLTADGCFALEYNQQWPTAALWGSEAITITYLAGYDDQQSIPAAMRAALLLLIGHLYENREAVTVTQGITGLVLPMGVDRLLSLYRVR